MISKRAKKLQQYIVKLSKEKSPAQNYVGNKVMEMKRAMKNELRHFKSI